MTLKSVQPAKKPINDSMFYMWRCLIVMAHADGVIHENERDFFEKVFANMQLAYDVTPEHLATLENDLKVAQDIDTLLPHVTNPEFSSLLVYFSQVVAWIDGDLNPKEAELLKKLNANRDRESEDVMSQVRQEMAAQMARRKADSEKNILRNPLFYALDALLDRLGIPPIE